MSLDARSRPDPFRLIVERSSGGPFLRKFNLNLDWKVLVGDPHNAVDPDLDESSWRSVTLPYAWNEDDIQKGVAVIHAESQIRNEEGFTPIRADSPSPSGSMPMPSCQY